MNPVTEARINISINSVDSILNKAFDGLSVKTNLADMVSKFTENLYNKPHLYVAELAADPKNQKKLRNIAAKIKYLDSNYSTELQPIISKIGQQAKIIAKACKRNHVFTDEYYRFIKKFDGDINMKSNLQKTPLIAAVEQGNLPLISLLVDLGADINKYNGNVTSPLNAAVAHGNPEVVKLLVKLGADVNEIDGKGLYPIKCAIDNNNKEMLKLLSGFKARLEPGITYIIGSDSPETVHRLEIINFLIDLGVKVDGKLEFRGMTPLTLAVLMNKPKTIELLVDKGANLDMPNAGGLSPLTTAIYADKPELIKLLVKKRANLDAPDGRGLLPLITAIKINNERLVKLLLDFGADVNCNSAPLCYAVAMGNHKMVKLLLENGADPSTSGDFGGVSLLPMEWALKNDDQTMVRILKEGSIATAQEIDKGTMQISKKGETDSYDIDYILKMIWQVKNTRYCEAVMDNNITMVKQMLSEGVDPDIMKLPMDPEYTPLAYAIATNNEVLRKVLEENGANKNYAYNFLKLRFLGNVLGLRGSSQLKDRKGQIHKVSLEGLYSSYGKKMLGDYAQKFFKSKDSLNLILPETAQQEILEAIRDSLCREKPNIPKIIEKIHSGKPLMIWGGIDGHTITMVLHKNKLIVCNRGLGKRTVATMIYKLPTATITPELIQLLTKKYDTIEEFDKEFDALKLELKTGYDQKNQKTGNCTWAGGKGAFGALLREYAGETRGKKGYKAFTWFSRKEVLENILISSFPWDDDPRLRKRLLAKARRKGLYSEKVMKLLSHTEA